MRSSHGATQPPPDSRKPMRIFGCFSQTPPQITARHASIISIVWLTMCLAARPSKRSMPTVGDPAGPALLVFQFGRLDRALPGADSADSAHPLLAAEELRLDEELLLAGLVVDDQPRRPVAILRVHVVGPQIERFEDVAIGVDDV